MSSIYRGKPSNLVSSLPTAIAIASSTNATPIVVTTSTDHGYETGDVVLVTRHNTNTAARGVWTITKLTDTTFELDGSVGNGVGGATGRVRGLGFGGGGPQPDDGDDLDAASVDVMLEMLADRTALLLELVHGHGFASSVFQPGGPIVDLPSISTDFIPTVQRYRIPNASEPSGDISFKLLAGTTGGVSIPTGAEVTITRWNNLASYNAHTIGIKNAAGVVICTFPNSVASWARLRFGDSGADTTQTDWEPVAWGGGTTL